jgi:hypothetical protein
MMCKAIKWLLGSKIVACELEYRPQSFAVHAGMQFRYDLLAFYADQISRSEVGTRAHGMLFGEGS